MVEILVVLAIIGVLSSVSLPAFLKIQKRSKLNRSTEMIFDQIRLARTEAASLNRTVAFLLIEPQANAGEGKAYTQIQRFYETDLEPGALTPQYKPSTKRINLAEGIVIHSSPEWSNLLKEEGTSRGEFVRSGEKYRSILIYPSGKTSLNDDNSEEGVSGFFITLVYQEEIDKKEPAVFVTITIDPKTALPKVWKK